MATKRAVPALLCTQSELPHACMEQSEDSREAARTALEAPSDQSLRVACYCEENVWRLAYRRLYNNRNNSTYYVVFISNEHQCVAMWHQLAARTGMQPCLWDYHVILIETSQDKSFVLDMDTKLSYPCPFAEYMKETFQKGTERHTPLFRVVEASMYLKHFASDRSHMYDKVTKTWSAPPPTYACIQGNNSRRSNLNEHIAMEERPSGVMGRAQLIQQANEERFGVTMTLKELEYFFIHYDALQNIR